MPALFKAGAKAIIIIIILGGFQGLFGFLGLMGGGVGMHAMHVMNIAHPLCPEVSDEYTPLQLPLVLRMGTFEFVLLSTHGATCVDFDLTMHMRGYESPACKVGNPITEIIVMRCDEASLHAVEGVVDGKCRSTSITIVRQVRLLGEAAQEYIIPKLLRP